MTTSSFDHRGQRRSGANRVAHGPDRGPAPGSAGGRASGIARLRARWAPGPWNGEATTLTVVVFVLVMFGLVMSFSASFVDAAEAGDPFMTFRRQLIWAALGLGAFTVAARLDHGIWRRLAWPLIVLALILLALVLVPGVGVEVYGATRWIGVGPMVVQPSEIVKLAALIWLADVLERKRPKDGSLHTVPHLLIPAVPALVVACAMVLLQPDLGTAILLTLIVGAILWVEGLPGRYVAGAVGLAGLAIATLAMVAPYRVARIRGWLWPEAHAADEGFQLLQSWYALGSGGWFGLGLGSSRGKWHFIPNPETDFIFAVIGEELGLIGSLAVVGLFSAVLYLGLQIAYKAADGFGRTVAFAITVWIVGQALVNIGTVTGLLPITGVTLPLLSVGGSSLVTTLLALGILVAIARRRPQPPAGERPEPVTALAGRRGSTPARPRDQKGRQ